VGEDELPRKVRSRLSRLKEKGRTTVCIMLLCKCARAGEETAEKRVVGRRSHGCTRGSVYPRVDDAKAQDGSLLPSRLPYLRDARTREYLDRPSQLSSHSFQVESALTTSAAADRDR